MCKEKKSAVINSQTWAEKSKAQEQYSKAHKNVRSIRTDKRNFEDDLARRAQEAARLGTLKELYATTKKLSGKYQQVEKPIKDKQGNSLNTVEEQLTRWAEHSREQLNRPPPHDPPDIPQAQDILPLKCDMPGKVEIKRTIKMLKNGKVVGPNAVPAKALKVDMTPKVNILHSLFKKIWEKAEVPDELKEGF